MSYDGKNNDEYSGIDSISAFDDDETGEVELSRSVSVETKRIINPDFVAKTREQRGKKQRRNALLGGNKPSRTDNNKSYPIGGNKPSQTDNGFYPTVNNYKAPRTPYKAKSRARSGGALSVIEPIFVLLSIASMALVFVDGVPLYASFIANVVEAVIYLIVFARRKRESKAALIAVYCIAAFALLISFTVYLDRLLPSIDEVARRGSINYLDGVLGESIFTAVVSLIITVVLAVIAIAVTRTGSPTPGALLSLIGGYILFLIILDFTVMQNMPESLQSVYTPSFFLFTIIGGALETIPGAAYAIAVFYISLRKHGA